MTVLDPAESPDFAAHLRRAVRGYGAAPMIEFERIWFTGDDVTGYIDAIEHELDRAGVSGNFDVALVVRNRPQHAAAILGLVGAPRSFSLVYAFQSTEAIARDIERLRPAAVIADVEDWSDVVVAAAAAVGSVGITLALDGVRVGLVEGLECLGDGPFADAADPPAVGVLTSGTTGTPKRINLAMPVLERGVLSATSLSSQGGDGPPDLVFWPFGGIGGIAQVIASPFIGKRMVLLEKYTTDDWVDAVRRYGITFVGVQPAVIRMLLDASVPPEDLASLEFLFGGSGPLEPETRELFEERYGIPVFWAYGATEFAGTVLAWTPDLYRQFAASKRGSAGRPTAGTEVRVVDVVTGAELPIGEQGLLEAKVELIGPDWVRTTDLASIDADGFVFLHGRGDGAINRGGFKVLPETVQNALVEHPAVLDASVVGVPDRRLGEVPFAVIELAEGAASPGQDELIAFLRTRLPAHHIPVGIQVVDELPRTPSLKVSLQEVKVIATAGLAT